VDCGSENAALETEIYQVYGEQGVIPMAIGKGQTVQQARDWRILHSLTYPVLADEQMTVTPLFLPDWGGGTFILPHSCIVDDHQILQWTHFGYDPFLTIGEIDSIVNALLDPEITASVSNIEFSGVEIYTSAEITIYLDNTGTGILQVTGASVTGLPYSVNFTPGEVYSVDDSLAVTVEFAPEESGPFSDVLTITSGEGELQIPIIGSVGVDDLPEKGIPGEFALLGNYPNPFNSETVIEFALPVTANIVLEVYSPLGKTVTTIQTGREYRPGIHQLTFNAEGLPSGLYFYRLTAGDYRAAGKMVFVK